jgi:cytochrome c peroxidase
LLKSGNRSVLLFPVLLGTMLVMSACSSNDPVEPGNQDPELPLDTSLAAVFQGTIDPDNLHNYADQPVPRYIRRNNAATRPISDAGATLGRVLFYDKQLSVDGTVSCASCHHQELAFGDANRAAVGINGETARHSMRLVNVQFSAESHMFWDERATSLEDQVLQPIQDDIEMGFSGEDGQPGLDSLLTRMQGLEYYRQLFALAYGDSAVTPAGIQDALSQFVRSIRSFDSRYDEGRAQESDDRQPFPNFTEQENFGKELFFAPPELSDTGVRLAGGLACAGCHQAPEFAMDPETQNNGLIRTISGLGFDQNVTRAPTLRNVVRADGTENGPFMHTGDLDLDGVLDHYNHIPDEGNTNLDNRLNPQDNPQRLLLTEEERAAVKAFLRTLAGQEIYTHPRWSDPFPTAD